jgi:hypothetical protein
VELQEPAAEQYERLGRQPLSHACQVRQDLEQAVDVAVQERPAVRGEQRSGTSSSR